MRRRVQVVGYLDDELAGGGCGGTVPRIYGVLALEIYF
jgi:hypothetical protein